MHAYIFSPIIKSPIKAKTKMSIDTCAYEYIIITTGFDCMFSLLHEEQLYLHAISRNSFDYSQLASYMTDKLIDLTYYIVLPGITELCVHI